MKKVKLVKAIFTQEEIANINTKNIELEEENKALKNELMEDMKTESKLNEEIKKLKSDLSFKNTMLDNVKAEYESLQDVIKKLEEENRLLKSEIVWLKDHTKYNFLKDEMYIDGTMTATEAKMRLREAEEHQNYVSRLEEENKKLKEERDFFKEQAILWRKDWKAAYEEKRKLKSDLGTVIDERDNNIKQNKKLRERIKELETDYDRLKVAFEDVVSGK